MNYKIALIRGDGIGPEVVGEAVKVMETVGAKFGHSFEFVDVMMGGCAIDAVGKSYPDGTAEKCKACDAVLLVPSGATPATPLSGPRPPCCPSARTWGCTPICVPPPCAPPWPGPAP